MVSDTPAMGEDVRRKSVGNAWKRLLAVFEKCFRWESFLSAFSLRDRECIGVPTSSCILIALERVVPVELPPKSNQEHTFRGQGVMCCLTNTLGKVQDRASL